MAVAVKEITAIERARLFVQGRQMDLLRSLERPQRMLVPPSSLIFAPLTRLQHLVNVDVSVLALRL